MGLAPEPLSILLIRASSDDIPVFIALSVYEVSGESLQMHRLDFTQYRYSKAMYMTWASTQENLSSGLTDNKGADQPAHSHSLVSASVIRFLESIKSRLAMILASLYS